MSSWLYIFVALLQLQFCMAFVVSSKPTSTSSNARRIPRPRASTTMSMSNADSSSRSGSVTGPDTAVPALTVKKKTKRTSIHATHSRGIPKAETGILSLLQKYPEADGRGIKIAILDTGCDLAAAGLSVTTDGKPKYLDFIDCTGGGDVDMNKTVAVTYEEGKKKEKRKIVKGLSGRNLTLGEWATDVEEFRVGAVSLFHLLPNSVKRRVKEERKKSFMLKHDALISKTQMSLDAVRSGGGSGDKAEKIKEIKELELLLEQLQNLAQSYQDSGPLMDILMFDDGESWRVVVDLEADGDLTKSIPMAPFGYERQFGELAFGSAVTFCVQVYDEGKTLSIVTDAGSHGTHVAGIAAANFASEDADGDDSNKAHLNGVAPGAQVLACKIGDGRLGSAETGTGLVRALIAAKKYGCDLVNLSYGEPSWQPDSGRVAQTFSDAVHKWGMTVFTSAGNDGPALSSLGSPGTLSAPITVGAYVSPEMMVDQYSTLPPEDEDGPLGGASYYFSSRGPTPDGSNPDICAPGGAISPIPRHALQGKAQYHGTSMSSPNACGVAACILSALKLKGVDDCGPIELRRGLVNSATTVDIDDTFAQGSGLISAVGAVDYIVKNHGKEGQSLAIDVTIPSRNNARGVYIRDAIELEGPMTFGVLVQPRFDHAIKRSSEEMDELLNLELDLELKPSQPWVKCPESMTLLSAQERNGQTFSVRVDPTELGPGAHFGTIDAIDKSDPARGVLFSVPVTVIVPHSQFTSEDAPRLKINDEEYVKKRSNGLDFSMAYKLIQGVPNRRFFTAPQGAEWATIKLRSTGPNPSGKSPQNVLLHAIPFVRGDIPNTRIQLKRVFQVKEGVEQEYHMRVKGGATLELCLQLLWLANPSPTSIIADVEFHSLNACTPTLVATQPITIAAATEFARLGASAPLRSEKLTPHASLKFVERAIRPDKYDIKSGSTELDILPLSDAESRSFDGNQSNDASSLGSQIYEMRLDYKFKIEGDKPIAVTPSIPSLFNQLYDSPLDSQLWVLKDSNSRVLGFGGAMHHADSVSLKKGDYNISLLLRHPDRSLLEALKDIPCQISLDLPSPLVCKVYGHLDKASTPSVTNDGRSPLGTIRLQKGSHQDLYVSRPTESLPAWISPGDSIVGSLNLDKGNAGGTAMKLVYAVPPKAKTKKASDSETSNDDDKEDITMTDTIFKAKLSYLASIRMKDNEAYKKLAAELKKENSTSIPLLTELLTFARKAPLPSDETNEQEWRAKEVEQVYNSLKIDNDGPVDEAALAQYFGLNQPDKDELEEDKEAKKLKKDMEDQKKILQKTLFARASILGEIASGGAGVDDFDKSVKEMKKWVGAKDLEDDDKIQLQILLARHANICLDKKTTALSILLKARKDLPEDGYKDITNEIMKIYESFEDMNHLFENANDDIHDRFPVLNTLL